MPLLSDIKMYAYSECLAVLFWAILYTLNALRLCQ